MSFKHTYFIDRALGKSMGKTLQSIGVKVEFHNQHFQPDSPDTEWLPIVSQKGWIVLTKDENIGRNPLEVKAMAMANAKVFALVSGNLNSQQMRNIFVNAIEKIDNFAQGNNGPFIAKIYRNSQIKMWKNQTALRKVLKDKPTP
jgi:predicted nuclease of predicted toxin-antitoxin system